MTYESLQKDCIYHLYNRGNNKENLFKKEENYLYFLKLSEKYLYSHFDIFAYVLLPNHFHILVRVKEDALKATQQLSNFFNSYTKAINKAYNRSGSLFQKPYRRKQIESEDYLRNVIIYIHQNPQNHLLIDDFEKYKYSSYLYYKKRKQSLLDKDFAISLFDDLENFIFCHQKIMPTEDIEF